MCMVRNKACQSIAIDIVYTGRMDMDPSFLGGLTDMTTGVLKQDGQQRRLSQALVVMQRQAMMALRERLAIDI